MWLVVQAYRLCCLTVVLSLCYEVASVCLKLPCTLALWYFHKKKMPLLRKLKVAITIFFTIKLATSDSPEVTLSRHGVSCVDISCPVCTKCFCARLQIKFGEAA